MASLFYAGALLLNEYKEEPINMFICIFAMNFGALASGQANQFGPDVGKAKSAATRIFSVIEHPTEITAMHSNGKKKQQDIDINKFKGNIEFHNVWFRYPTRKNDWILRGLNLKINTCETVALVGESGCGKSTIVSLILRLYDVDYG
jgi:ATP-binding cassette subfamily B (MDR/TAP) protein 1